MDIKSKPNRATLKSYFVKNAIPTQRNFEDLIDGLINQVDDGIAKLPGEPLSLQADISDTGLKKVVNFYKNFTDQKPAWTLSLNPRIDPNVAATAKPGWSVGDADGNSKLFIDESTGNIGIGTVTPGGYKLNVNGAALFTGNYLYVNSENAGRLRVGAAWGMPGLYSSDDGAKSLTLGVPAGQKVYLGVSTGDAFVEGGTGNSYFKGNVGIGTNAPWAKLDVSGVVRAVSSFNSSKDPDSGMANGGSLVIKSNAPQIDFIDTDHNDWSIHVNSNKMYFIRQPWIHNDLVLDGAGGVGIGTDSPAGKLEVNGAAIISDGNSYATRNNFMASGSLTVGGITANYGGGRGWNPSTAGLLLETLSNTEIAVHDSGIRVASLLYYEGDNSNRITIGRDMGWGTISMVEINSPVMERLEVINCGGRGDWTAANHPIMQYFRTRLKGKPVGTYLKAIQDHPDWRGHYWQGWVDVDGKIRVIHNNHNTGAVA